MILVVEDKEGVRLIIKAVLERSGYRTLMANNGDDAVAVWNAHKSEIALLFTDVGLPGRNGRLLAEEARRVRPGLKVLYTTGYARDAIVHQGILDSGVHLLPKPYTIETLARKLRAVLDAKQSAPVVP